ncbi:hypothetical protein [Neopusillimonas aromaticivorans]|uniref:hypothetical protein n=1 Tax=Neopusillimonas aromaticivorans TaxID=2979868 RepID=UPI002598F32E|nr:hypothetical protein [Neopusillimonas aromaticivorans]WJJ93347.1 hypothetical protein N7E01_15340 [Neopusillimonas aromaticivorans]
MVKKKTQENTGLSKAVEQRSPYKSLSNPASTGGAGGHYEAKIQATYLWAMLIGKLTSLQRDSRITSLSFQAKIDGHETDDLVCELTNSAGQKAKALIQVKRSLSANASDGKFKEAITAAWLDFQNHEKFERNRDRIVLAYDESLSPKINGAKELSKIAKTSLDCEDFQRKAITAGFSSTAKRGALAVVRSFIEEITSSPLPDEEQFLFWKHLLFVSHSVDDEGSNEHASALTEIAWVLGAELAPHPASAWALLVDTSLSFNSTAASVNLETIDAHLPPHWVPALRAHRDRASTGASLGLL